MIQVIIPISLILGGIAVWFWWPKKKEESVETTIKDDSYDCWHREYEDVWRKIA